MNHIGDGNKMVSDTPRTDAEILEPEIVHQDSHSEGWVSIDFARQLERELDRCNNLFRKLDVHSLNLSDLIRKLERELQQWREYAGRLEEAGNLSDDQRGCTTCDEYVCIECRKASEAWDKAKETKP